MNYQTSDIEQLKTERDSLPKGYISRKIINGKERYYLQWREGPKTKSLYLKDAELEIVRKQIARRKELEAEIRARQSGLMLQETPAAYGQPVLYLKWADETVAEVLPDHSVRFLKPELNETLRLYTRGKDRWSREELTVFLAERIPSRDRRDIETLLRRCGLTAYDPLQLGIATRAINARDLLWLAEHEDERFEDAVTEVFRSVFFQKTDLQGDSVDTPEGYNVKRYGVYKGRYGIYKKRIHPLSTDVESELAVSKLAHLFGIPCCDCFRTDEDTVFSAFHYDFAKESIVHFRRLAEAQRGSDLFLDLIALRPQYFAGFVRVICLDFLTRQDDRHLSNLAVKIAPEGESLYPLYDNGRSLFYEDTEETVTRAVCDIPAYATAFGPEGTYWDQIRNIRRMGVDFSRLLRLDVTQEELKAVLSGSGLTGYRLDGSLEWIAKGLEELKK